MVRARGNKARQGCRGEGEGESKGGEASNEQLLRCLVSSLRIFVCGREISFRAVFRFNPILSFISTRNETLVAVLVVLRAFTNNK